MNTKKIGNLLQGIAVLHAGIIKNFVSFLLPLSYVIREMSSNGGLPTNRCDLGTSCNVSYFPRAFLHRSINSFSPGFSFPVIA